MPTPALERILYVDDEPDIQRVASLALEATGGFEVTLCGSGAEALSEIRRRPPDLILLDVMMPDMDGPSTLRALRAVPDAATVPVIFMTAKVQPHEIEGYLELGAIDVIAKPFNPMTLAEAVQTLWARHHG